MNINLNEWLDAVEAAYVRPEGAITISEYRERKGLSEKTATRRLEDAVKNGLARKQVCSLDGHRRVLYIPVKLPNA